MVLKTTNIDAEIERVEALVVTAKAQIATTSNTLRQRKVRLARFVDMLGRLNAAKIQSEKFNVLDKVK